MERLTSGPGAHKFLITTVFYTLFCLVLTVNLAGAVSSSIQDDCHVRRCNHHDPPIRFPFRLQDQQPPHCGYPHPGFQLSCSENKKTMLKLPRSMKLLVKHIDYEAQRIDLYDPSRCLWRQLLHLNLPTFPFVDELEPAESYTLLECSSQDKALYERNRVDCLSTSASQIIAFRSDGYAYYDNLLNCSLTGNFSAPISPYDFRFQLRWYKPDCGDCEAQGKGCRLKTNSTKDETECFLLPKKDVCDARAGRSNPCGPSVCGNVEIRWPFRLKDQPRKCGDKRFELQCNRNRTVSFPMKYGNFYVLHISYVNWTIRLVDASLVDGNCSIPRSSIAKYINYDENIIDWYQAYIMYLVNCTTKMNSSVYIDVSRCGTNGNSSSSPWTYFYFSGEYSNISDFHQSCRFVAQFPFQLSNITGLSSSDIYSYLLKGVDVSWNILPDWPSNPILKVLLKWSFILVTPIAAYVINNLAFLLPGIFDRHWFGIGTYFVCLAISGILLARTLLGIFCLIALVTHKFRRRHLSMDDTIETFLQTQNNFVPIRYSYFEIKRMTEGFKVKLGQA